MPLSSLVDNVQKRVLRLRLLRPSKNRFLIFNANQEKTDSGGIRDNPLVFHSFGGALSGLYDKQVHELRGGNRIFQLIQLGETEEFSDQRFHK